MTARLKTLLRRIIDRIAAPYVESLETRFSWLSTELGAAREELSGARNDLARGIAALRAVHDEEHDNRRRLLEERIDA